VYPPIADQLADLAARLATNDAQLEIANRHARPAGAEHLRSAEELARALTRGFGVLGTEIPRITRDLRLPAFKYVGYSQAFEWPRSR